MSVDATADTGAQTALRRPLPAHNWGWFLFRGILALILGVLAILFPFSAIVVFALFFAAFAFVDGIIFLVSGIRGAAHHREHWRSLVLSGLVGIAVGVIYLLWPMLSTIGYALVTLLLLAAWAIATGLLQIVAAIRLRREIEGEWLMALTGALSLILGLAVLAFTWWVPGSSIVSVGWIIGVYALLAGFSLVTLALRLRRIGESA